VGRKGRHAASRILVGQRVAGVSVGGFSKGMTKMRDGVFRYGQVVVVAAALGLAGCGASETLTRGYIPSEQALSQVKPGNSQDQVLVALGTPTSISTINGDVFYYISEKQQRSALWQPPRTVERNVLAVYFDGNRRVERVANYGLQDGIVFDFLNRTTPTGGEEANIIRQIMAGPRT